MLSIMDADKEVYTWLLHLYFWSATVREELQCAKKLGNVKDRYITLIITCFMSTRHLNMVIVILNSARAG